MAVDRYNRENGAAIGRGAYRAAVDATAIVQRCRKKIAELLGAEGPDRIVFTFNGTDSLNLALHGLLHAGDHVVTSSIEHNSVLRPLGELRRRLGIEVTQIRAGATGSVDPADFKRALRPNTRLIALIHASNVTGAIQPVAAVGEIARKAGVPFLVDAAQSAGHLPFDVRSLSCDILACPGHKGLLGLLGTGVLYLAPGIEERLSSLRQGGTGTKSEIDVQPATLPDKYESGNHNAPGLVGLEVGTAWILERSLAALHRHEQSLTGQLIDGFSGIGGVRVFGPADARERVGVVSVTIEGFDPQDASNILDQSFDIQTRAGLHCAPGAHRAAGSFDAGGTIRFSVGPFTTGDHVAAAVDAVRKIAATS